RAVLGSEGRLNKHEPNRTNPMVSPPTWTANRLSHCPGTDSITLLRRACVGELSRKKLAIPRAKRKGRLRTTRRTTKPMRMRGLRVLENAEQITGGTDCGGATLLCPMN